MILVVDKDRLLDFRDFQDPGPITEELQAILPDTFSLKSRWLKDIRETCSTLAEGHTYSPMDISYLIEMGCACLLLMGTVRAHIYTNLSMSAYKKIVEKKGEKTSFDH